MSLGTALWVQMLELGARSAGEALCYRGRLAQSECKAWGFGCPWHPRAGGLLQLSACHFSLPHHLVSRTAL